MRIRITYLITVFVSILLLVIGHKMATDGLQIFKNVSHAVVRAKVINIIERVEPGRVFFDYDDDYNDEELHDDFFPMMIGERIIFEAKITSGAGKGDTVTVSQNLNNFMRQDKIREVIKNTWL